MQTLFEQIAANSRPLIKNYLDDLEKHDKAALSRDQIVPFIHYTRENGTHLLFLPPHDHESYPPEGKFVPYLFGDANREHIRNEIVSQAEYAVKNKRTFALLVQYFDGKALRSISPERALEIAREYHATISYEWRQRDRLLMARNR